MSTKTTYGPTALIVGGSEGIGLCLAQRLAAEGLDLILVARTQAKLDEAATSISQQHGVKVTTHSIDLCQPITEDTLKTIGGDSEIGLMIYNAGADGKMGLFLDLPVSDADDIVTLNCINPSRFCHYFAPAMVANKHGGVVFVSSLASLAGSAYVTSYSSAKSFINNFAEGLYQELKPSGVHVLGFLVGATRTPAMHRAGLSVDSNPMVMESDQVAESLLANLANGPIQYAGANADIAPMLRDNNRGPVGEMMSSASAEVAGKPWPPVYE